MQDTLNRLAKKLQLIWIFYKGFSVVHMSINLVALVMVWNTGFSLLSFLLWLKIISSGTIFYFIHQYKQKEYYYFQNLGLSRVFIWVSISGFDFFLFVLLILQTYKYR